jgi:hypothetical protein
MGIQNFVTGIRDLPTSLMNNQTNRLLAKIGECENPEEIAERVQIKFVDSTSQDDYEE